MTFKYYLFTIVFFGLLTCQRTRGATNVSKPEGCFVNDLPDGFELVCDGVPHQVHNGKDGAAGPAGRNGGPGPKGDVGPKGDPGPGGRSVIKLLSCHDDWGGSPAYTIDYQVFTFSDGTKEASATVEMDDNDFFANSAIYLKDDPRGAAAKLDVGGFLFVATETSATVKYRGTDRTDNMTCH